MATPDKQSADKRLRRILLIHKKLRQKSCSGAELAEACETDNESVSLRTIRSDIEFMRKVLNAPIQSDRYNGYRYQKPWSLLEGLEDEPLGTFNEVLAYVRRLTEKTPKAMAGLEEALLSLEQQVSVIRAETNVYIEFDNPDLRGRPYLIALYDYIRRGVFVRVFYQPFTADAPTWRTIFPLMLKEFNNRWYVIAWAKDGAGEVVIQSLALDRMEQKPVETATLEVFERPKKVDLREYYRNVIGMTKVGNPQKVELVFSANRSKYVATKKLHFSQEEEQLPDGRCRITLVAELNKELRARILEFGADVEVILPLELREQIREELKRALVLYNS